MSAKDMARRKYLRTEHDRLRKRVAARDVETSAICTVDYDIVIFAGLEAMEVGKVVATGRFHKREVSTSRDRN